MDVPTPTVDCPYEAPDMCAASSTPPLATCCERVQVLSGAIPPPGYGLSQWLLCLVSFAALALHVLRL